MHVRSAVRCCVCLHSSVKGADLFQYLSLLNCIDCLAACLFQAWRAVHLAFGTKPPRVSAAQQAMLVCRAALRGNQVLEAVVWSDTVCLLALKMFAMQGPGHLYTITGQPGESNAEPISQAGRRSS